MAEEIRKFAVRGGSLLWLKNGPRAVVTGVEGSVQSVEIPTEIEGLPVTEIDKKAFFNSRMLTEVVLPDSIESIGNWAFAHCRRLKKVELPGRRMQLGRDLFIGDEGLEEIVLRPQQADTAAMLAAAATKMGDPYLFSIDDAGSFEWMQRWDARMLVILREPDSTGFEGQIMTGEEDYVATDFGRFVRKKREAKVRLAFLRLLHPDDLAQDIRKELEEYLISHTKGCDSEETWQVLLQEFGGRKVYFELFARLGCVTQENFDDILKDIGEGQPEMKAWFMKYKEESLGYADFFDSLSLDF